MDDTIEMYKCTYFGNKLYPSSWLEQLSVNIPTGKYEFYLQRQQCATTNSEAL